jgi:hypothetical protein
VIENFSAFGDILPGDSRAPIEVSRRSSLGTRYGQYVFWFLVFCTVTARIIYPLNPPVVVHALDASRTDIAANHPSLPHDALHRERNESNDAETYDQKK